MTTKDLLSIFALFLLSICFLKGQNMANKLYYNVGSGISILGFGDVRTVNFQNELDYKINKYFSTSLSFIHGQGLKSYGTPTLNIVQANANILCSPFGNHRIWNLRLGSGISYHRNNAIRVTERTLVNGEIVEIRYREDRKRGWGYNIIIDNTFRLNSRYIAGYRVYTRPYLNGEINTGILVRMGIRLY